MVLSTLESPQRVMEEHGLDVSRVSDALESASEVELESRAAPVGVAAFDDLPERAVSLGGEVPLRIHHLRQAAQGISDVACLQLSEHSALGHPFAHAHQVAERIEL